MKKQITYLTLGILFLLLILINIIMISASSVNYMPINQPNNIKWNEWEIIKATDANTSVIIDNPLSQITNIYVYNTVATNALGLSTSKNVYDSTGKLKTTIPLTQKKVYVGASAVTKYGYSYTTSKGETYVKIGDNTTIISWVNQTGGDAWKGYNLQPNLTSPINNPHDFPIYNLYTSDEKTIVSVDNATYVTGEGSGIGGLDCNFKQGLYDTRLSSACITLSQSICSYYYFFSELGAITCDWNNASNICTGAQSCSIWSIHKYLFNVTKLGATNINWIMDTVSGTSGNPAIPVTNEYYLYNQTSSAYVHIGSTSCANVVGTQCNFTYSTGNVADFISSGNQVIALVQTTAPNLNVLNARYTQLSINYLDMIINYRALSGLNIFQNYRTVNGIPLTINWRIK